MDSWPQGYRATRRRAAEWSHAPANIIGKTAPSLQIFTGGPAVSAVQRSTPLSKSLAITPASPVVRNGVEYSGAFVALSCMPGFRPPCLCPKDRMSVDINKYLRVSEGIPILFALLYSYLILTQFELSKPVMHACGGNYCSHLNAYVSRNEARTKGRRKNNYSHTVVH